MSGAAHTPGIDVGARAIDRGVKTATMVVTSTSEVARGSTSPMMESGGTDGTNDGGSQSFRPLRQDQTQPPCRGVNQDCRPCRDGKTRWSNMWAVMPPSIAAAAVRSAILRAWAYPPIGRPA